MELKEAIFKTESKLTQDILNLEGMSSSKVRHLLNNICSTKQTYLEIGCWKGSTLLSSAFENKNLTEITAIDNFIGVLSDDSAPALANSLRLNIEKYKSQTSHINFYDKDCFEFDLSLIKQPVDIYFYDGRHFYEDQFKAITYYYPILNEESIIIIDDFNLQEAKLGTEAALKETGLKILEKYELPARFNGDTELYWNGVLVLKVKK